MKAIFEISGWAGPETYDFEADDANGIVYKLTRVQELECLYRMGCIEGDNEDELEKLGSFIEKYNDGELEIEDLKEFEIHLSIGEMRCVEVTE